MKIERPAEVWVKRSVLDKRPRAVSIALNKDLYVAYSTDMGALYKAWKGKINYDGAVYNETHGFQPSTQGITFQEEPMGNPWSILMNGVEVVPAVIYRGHVFKNNQVTLKYDLRFGKDTIHIEEQPEYFSVSGDSNKVGFERKFRMSAVPENARVSLHVHAGSRHSTNQYSTSGKFEMDSQNDKQSITGNLVLNKDETVFSIECLYRSVAAGKEVIAGNENTAAALMTRNDCATCHNERATTIGPAYIDIARRYSAYPAENEDRLAMKIINGGAGNWGSVAMTPHPDISVEQARSLVRFIIDMDSAGKAVPVKNKTSEPLLALIAHKENKPADPGDGIELRSVHPSFSLAQARPESFKPRVGGMDFLDDGRLVICTWDSLGSVYILDGVQGNEPAAIHVKKIATGLAEPLGLKVVDNEIYVLQKQELTRLIDNDQDEITDEYQAVCNGWKVSDNFHEFAFGLVYKDGYFYGTLATAINNGGTSFQPQIRDRGKVVKISRKDGSFTLIASGLRTPNGIGTGVDNEIFIADNQGDWLPANKIVHLQENAWYGSRSVDFEGTKNLTPIPPVVWLQQNDIANSPSQLTSINKGIYQNQMIHGDVTHGGLKRVFAEKINGSYQGAVFRFSQGLEAGINRLVWGPDSALYVGGIGSTGNWGQPGKFIYGLQRLNFNGKTTFEMLAVRAMNKGIEIEFTEPLKADAGNSNADYKIKQWWYLPTADYGGPKMDEEQLTIKKVRVSADRKKVFVELPGMKAGHVIYIRLNKRTVVSEQGESLWSTESWYTMNTIPAKQ